MQGKIRLFEFTRKCLQTQNRKIDYQTTIIYFSRNYYSFFSKMISKLRVNAPWYGGIT